MRPPAAPMKGRSMASSCRRPLVSILGDSISTFQGCNPRWLRRVLRGASAVRQPGAPARGYLVADDDRRLGRRATCPTAPFPQHGRRRGFSRGFKRRAHRGAFATGLAPGYRHRVFGNQRLRMGEGGQSGRRPRTCAAAGSAGVRIARRRRCVPRCRGVVLERLRNDAFAAACVVSRMRRRGAARCARPLGGFGGPHVHRRLRGIDVARYDEAVRIQAAAHGCKTIDLCGVRARLRGVDGSASRRARHAPDCGHGSRIHASAGASIKRSIPTKGSLVARGGIRRRRLACAGFLRSVRRSGAPMLVGRATHGRLCARKTVAYAYPRGFASSIFALLRAARLSGTPAYKGRHAPVRPRRCVGARVFAPACSGIPGRHALISRPQACMLFNVFLNFALIRIKTV